jgi:hypothetical protein
VDPGAAGLGDREKRKFLTLPGLELRPLSRYTDYAIPAPFLREYATDVETNANGVPGCHLRPNSCSFRASTELIVNFLMYVSYWL